MQLSLPFKLNAKMLWQDFVGDKNQQIIKFLSALFNQSDSAITYIYGEKSTGKTHLLQGCAFEALDKSLSVMYLDFSEKMPSGILDDLESHDWVCIDNVELLNDKEQQALFDLYNRSLNSSVKLLISGNNLPNQLNLLKDLETRLSLSTVFALEVLSDQQKKQIIQQQMTNKNLTLEHKIIDYLLKYYSRDLSDLLDAVDRLDRASLQQKSAITIPLVKQVLAI